MSSLLSSHDDIAFIPFDDVSLRTIFRLSGKTACWTDGDTGLVEVMIESWDLSGLKTIDKLGRELTHPYSLFSAFYAVMIPPEAGGVSRSRLIGVVMDNPRTAFSVDGLVKESVSEPLYVRGDPAAHALSSQLEYIEWDRIGKGGFWALEQPQCDSHEPDAKTPSIDEPELVETKTTSWAYIGIAQLSRSIGSLYVTWKSPVLARMCTGTSGQGGATLSDKSDQSS